MIDVRTALARRPVGRNTPRPAFLRSGLGLGRVCLAAPGPRVCAPLLVLLALLAGGCGAPAPIVTLDGARIADRSDEAVVIDFLFSAENPGNEALPLRLATYTVSLDGREVFRGTRSAEATLRRRGIQQFRLPASVPADLIPEDAQTGSEVPFAIAGNVQYLTPGVLSRVMFDARLRRPTASFSASGTLELGESFIDPIFAPNESSRAQPIDSDDRPTSTPESAVPPSDRG